MQDFAAYWSVWRGGGLLLVHAEVTTAGQQQRGEQILTFDSTDVDDDGLWKRCQHPVG